MKPPLKALALGGLLLFAGLPLASADDEFSRANCFNNESITFSIFSTYDGNVISQHFDRDNGNTVHYVGASVPAFCYGWVSTACPTTCVESDLCLWEILYGRNRMAAIHNTEDAVAWPLFTQIGAVVQSSRWRVVGKHTHFLGYLFDEPIYYVATTEAVDCNLRLDQFY